MSVFWWWGLRQRSFGCFRTFGFFAGRFFGNHWFFATGILAAEFGFFGGAGRQGFVEFSPGPIDTGAFSAPPIIDILVGVVLHLDFGVVKHWADAAEKLGIDKFTSALQKGKKVHWMLAFYVLLLLHNQ